MGRADLPKGQEMRGLGGPVSVERRTTGPHEGRGSRLLLALALALTLAGVVTASALGLWWVFAFFMIIAPILSLGLIKRPERPELTGEDFYHNHP